MLSRYRIHLMIAVALLLAWLNWSSPAPVAGVVNVTERPVPQFAVTSTDSTSARTPSALATITLPDQLNRPALELASNDPFALPAPPPPVVAKLPPPPPPVQMAPPTPPPAPMAPPVNLRYTGRMTNPDGSQVVYVAFGETSLALTTGQSLPNGYRVEAITPRAVELSYPPLNTTARLDLPEPPKYEIR